MLTATQPTWADTSAAARDFAACQATCPADIGEGRCVALCRCTVDAFIVSLSPADYLSFSSQLSQNRLTPANRRLADEVALACWLATDPENAEGD